MQWRNLHWALVQFYLNNDSHIWALRRGGFHKDSEQAFELMLYSYLDNAQWYEK